MLGVGNAVFLYMLISFACNGRNQDDDCQAISSEEHAKRNWLNDEANKVMEELNIPILRIHESTTLRYDWSVDESKRGNRSLDSTWGL